VLAGERFRLIRGPTPGTLALLVGAADRGREAGRRVMRMAAEFAPGPPERMRRFLDETRERGEKTIRLGRLEARGWFDTIVPRMIGDMTPRVIDAAMPQIRTRVVPVIIEDLAADERVRALISEQSHGMISDATDELRETSARADDQLESGFKRLFRT
jgi:hypothetical protein